VLLTTTAPKVMKHSANQYLRLQVNWDFDNFERKGEGKEKSVVSRLKYWNHRRLPKSQLLSIPDL
jgi:hypothetical protein